MSAPTAELVISDLRRAGAETQLVRLAIHLGQHGFQPRVTLLKTSNDFAEELSAAGVPVVALGARSGRNLRLPVDLYRRLARSRPTVVHAFLPLATFWAVPLARALGTPVVVASQRASYESTLSPAWRRLVRAAQRSAHRILVNSTAARAEELRAGTPQERLRWIPNGIDPWPETAQPPRASLGLPNGPFVLCLAQLSVEKDHALLLDAWSLVVRREPAARLVLVGEGPRRAAIAARIEALGVSASVKMLGFRHPSRPYVAASNLVVLTSRTEGLPNALLEAMAAGRAVVATAVGDVPELLDHGRAGRLVEPRPEAVAAALSELLADADERERLGGEGRARAAQAYSTAAMVAATARVYREVLDDRGPAGAPRALRDQPRTVT